MYSCFKYFTEAQAFYKQSPTETEATVGRIENKALCFRVLTTYTNPSPKGRIQESNLRHGYRSALLLNVAVNALK